jgi:hypothetical protein
MISSKPRANSWLLLFAACALPHLLWAGWAARQHLTEPSRPVTILGAVACAAAIHATVRRETGSHRWALVGVSLFAAGYLDAGACDAWMLFFLLAGCFVLNYGRSGLEHCLGMLLLVAACWRQPEAAGFAIAGFFFLLFRLTPRELLAPGLVALAVGPILYFHSFSMHPAPLLAENVRNFAESLARHWMLPAVLTGAALMTALNRRRGFYSIWLFMVPVSFCTSLLGVATAGNGVFFPFAAWLILISVVALERLTRRLSPETAWPQIALAIMFLTLRGFPAA